MNLRESVKPLEYMKTHADEILFRVHETHSPIVITDGGEAKLVIQDIDSYQETQNALAMLKLAALGRRAVEQGEYLPAAAAFEKTEKRRSGGG